MHSPPVQLVFQVERGQTVWRLLGTKPFFDPAYGRWVRASHPDRTNWSAKYPKPGEMEDPQIDSKIGSWDWSHVDCFTA